MYVVFLLLACFFADSYFKSVSFILLSFALVAYAAPAKRMEMDDMMTSEGRNLHSYAPAPAPRYLAGGTVTSYNRRGSHAEASAPAIYGSSYAAAPVGIGAPHYHSAPVGGYAPVRSYPAPELSHGYAPQRNAYSENSRIASQDPNYDAARDPVSQYAAHIPVFDYAPRPSSSGNELSLYGYRK